MGKNLWRVEIINGKNLAARRDDDAEIVTTPQPLLPALPAFFQQALLTPPNLPSERPPTPAEVLLDELEATDAPTGKWMEW